MAQLKLIPMAILAFFGWLFAAPASAAQGKGGKSGGVNFLLALFMVCFAAIIGGAALANDADNALQSKYGAWEIVVENHDIMDSDNVSCLIEYSLWQTPMQGAGRYHHDMELTMLVSLFEESVGYYTGFAASEVFVVRDYWRENGRSLFDLRLRFDEIKHTAVAVHADSGEGFLIPPSSKDDVMAMMKKANKLLVEVPTKHDGGVIYEFDLRGFTAALTEMTERCNTARSKSKAKE